MKPKLYLHFFLYLCVLGGELSAQTQTRVTALPETTRPQDGDVLPVVRPGTSQGYKVTAGHFLNFSELRNNYAVVDLARWAGDEIDNRIAALTAGAGAQNLFSTRTDGGGGTYVWNTASFLHDVDLTCMSVWNSQAGGSPANSLKTATLISPRHVLMANHFYPPNGTIVRFRNADGVVAERTLTNSSRIGSTDIQIGILDTDVPPTITFAKAIDDPSVPLFNTRLAPVVVIDQTLKAFIGEVGTGGTGGGNVINVTPFGTPLSSAQRAAFSQSNSWIGGDSSHPCFLIVDGLPVVLFTNHTSIGSTVNSERVSAYVTEINAAMTSLGGSYQLTMCKVRGGGNAANYNVTAGQADNRVVITSDGGLIDSGLLANGSPKLATTGHSLIEATTTGHDDEFNLIFGNATSVAFNNGRDVSHGAGDGPACGGADDGGGLVHGGRLRVRRELFLYLPGDEHLAASGDEHVLVRNADFGLRNEN
jgi:hypothetical protein